MRKFAILATILCALTVVEGAPLAVVLNTNTTMDLVNVANNASFSAGSTPFVSSSLAKTLSGSLVSADAFGNLWDVTGAPIPVGPTGRTQIADLDFGAGGLWGYSNASSELFFFDLGLSSVTYSQTLAIPSSLTVTGVAYEVVTGDVYLSGYSALNNDKLLRVSAWSSTVTQVGNMANGDAFSYFSDIDFDATGTLYALSFYHRWFYTVSTANAATAFVSAGPHRDTTAMALDPVPEPLTLTGLTMALGWLCKRRRSA